MGTGPTYRYGGYKLDSAVLDEGSLDWMSPVASMTETASTPREVAGITDETGFVYDSATMTFVRDDISITSEEISQLMSEEPSRSLKDAVLQIAEEKRLDNIAYSKDMRRRWLRAKELRS